METKNKKLEDAWKRVSASIIKERDLGLKHGFDIFKHFKEMLEADKKEKSSTTDKK